MIGYLARRLAWGAWVVLVSLTLVLTLLLGVGDPCVAQLGGRARPEQIEACRRANGFDRPFTTQYLAYLGVGPCLRAGRSHADDGRCGLLQGDLGVSAMHGEPVLDVLLQRLPRTLLLAVVAMFFELAIGLAIGVSAAVKRGTWFDGVAMTVAFAGISAPTFLTGLVFLDALAFRLGWLPIGGYGHSTVDHLRHVLLPAMTLAIVGAASYARLARSELVDVLRMDWVRTARAKGLRPMRTLFSHGVRNALVPVVTVAGLQLSVLVSGAVITESIYAWPGIGRLSVEAIYTLDVFTVTGVVLLACVAVQVGNLLADLMVAWLDPRVRA